MDSKAVRYAAFAQLAQEDYVLAGFLNGNVEILDPLVLVFKVVELVVVGCEEAFCAVAPLVQVLHKGAGYGHSVVGGRAAANLVQEHQGALGEVVHNHRCLQHFHHKGGFSAGNVVRSANARENLVDIANFSAFGGHEAACLGHQYRKGCLAQEGRFSGHIGACQDYYLAGLAVQHYVVGDVFLPGRHKGLDYRMAALFYVQGEALVQDGAAVVLLRRQFRKSGKNVQFGKDAAVGLDLRDVLLDKGYQVCIYPGFQGVDLFFRPEYLCLVFLQFLRYVALCAYKGLLAHPLRRHLVLESVAHFKVIAEDVVVIYLQ